jgi:hypothetical protein
MCQDVRHGRRTHLHPAPQVDQARTDFAIIEDQLDAIYARLARMPTRSEIGRTALMGVIGGAGLVIVCFEVLWRHCI